jgi:hypothetical protein
MKLINAGTTLVKSGFGAKKKGVLSLEALVFTAKITPTYTEVTKTHKIQAKQQKIRRNKGNNRKVKISGKTT